MKNLTLAVLLTAVCGQSINAHHFEVDGIFYNVVNPAAKYVAVTYEGAYSEQEPDYFGDIVIPASVTYNNETYTVTEIGNDCFTDCAEMSSIQLPPTLTLIGEYAFDGCTGLLTIKIPESVTKIKDSAFYRCSNLLDINIPSSINKILYCTFEGCDKLKDIYCYPIVPPTVEESAFFGLNKDVCIHVNQQSVDSYLNSAWNEFTIVGDLAGINDVYTDEMGGIPFYYNLKGEPVDNPSKGIYIEVEGNDAKLIMMP